MEFFNLSYEERDSLKDAMMDFCRRCLTSEHECGTRVHEGELAILPQVLKLLMS